MKRLSHHILHIALPALALSATFPAGRACADSIIRITGDKTTSSQPGSSELTATEPPRSPVRGSSTIRITGDRESAPQVPTSGQTTLPEQSLSVSPGRGIRIIGDKKSLVQEKASEQPVINEAAEKDQKARAQAEEDRLVKEAVEQQVAQRLSALKAEEERKAAERVEQERLAQIKAEQDDEAARQKAIMREQEQRTAHAAEESRKAAEKVEQEKAAAEAILQEAIKKEQERLAVQKAKEAREAAEKAEQERIAASRAEEERLAATQRALIEKTLAESKITELPAGVNQDSKTDNTPGEVPAKIWDLYLSSKVNDPALGRTEARVTGSKADSDVLMSGLMPHVDSSAGVKQISQSFVNYTPTDTTFDYTALNYNITARMTLLNVPTIYSLSAADAGLKVEQAGVTAAQQNLIVKFIDAYFSLLKAQTDKQIAAGEINRLKQVLNQSQAFLKAGTGDIIAVYEAQSRLDGAKADLTRSESSLRLAEQKLSTIVGKPVTSVENYLPQQPAGPSPDDLDWWVATMEKEQPVLKQAREGLTQISEQRKAVKSEYLPVLQASGGYDVNRGTSLLPTAETRQWFVGASIYLPLYSGGETAAKVRRAVASEEERRHIFDETMDQQRENVKQAFFNLRYNISFIRALEQRKASAEIQLAAVSKGRTIGTRNAIDVLNAEQAYSLALRDYKYALYDNIIKMVQLKSAAGILSEDDVSGITAAPVLSSRLKQ